MQNITIAGRLGGDATHRTTDNSEVTSFNMAVDYGFGENKETYWWSVSMWGKRGAALAQHLRKGSSVTVTGEFSKREHEGKTYLQCRANDITLQGGKSDGERPASSGERQQGRSSGGSYGEQSGGGSRGGGAAALDDDVPFACEWRL